jgi:hypothetical protein
LSGPCVVDVAEDFVARQDRRGDPLDAAVTGGPDVAIDAGPFVAIIRSAGDTEVARALLQAMRTKPTAAFTRALDVPDVERRSDMLGALFIGVAFSRHVLTDGPLATMSPAELIASLIAPTRAILFEPLEAFENGTPAEQARVAPDRDVRHQP